MSRTRWLLVMMACLGSFTPQVAASVPVHAKLLPDKKVVVEVDDTFLAPNMTAQCGFDVWAHFVGTVTTSVRGNGVLVNKVHLNRTFIGPGGSLRAIDRGTETFTETISADGLTIILTIMTTGSLPYHIVVPGYGSIANNSGREIVQITLQWDEAAQDFIEVDFQVLFDSGPNDGLTDDEWAVVCAYLA